MRSHPRLFLPPQRKEVHFFDRYWDRGTEWYANFFPAERGDLLAVGEVTPQYFYPTPCPGRIARTVPDARLILMLRDPVERAYSQYWLRVRLDNYRGPFERFMEERPYAVDWGFYADRWRAYRAHFPAERILVLIHEEATVEPDATARSLGDFLGVDAAGFRSSAPRVNRSYVPHNRRLSSLAGRIGRKLRDLDQDWVIAAAKRAGVKRLFARGSDVPPMRAETRARLRELYQRDIEDMERELGRPLSVWTDAALQQR
jgi:hypothetical protein